MFMSASRHWFVLVKSYLPTAFVHVILSGWNNCFAGITTPIWKYMASSLSKWNTTWPCTYQMPLETMGLFVTSGVSHMKHSIVCWVSICSQYDKPRSTDVQEIHVRPDVGLGDRMCCSSFDLARSRGQIANISSYTLSAKDHIAQQFILGQNDCTESTAAFWPRRVVWHTG